MQLYDAPNCDYEPPKNFQQNFGNPYDCPEGFYNASMMSSVGYSQVADYSGKPNQQLLPGQIIAQQAAQQAQQQMMMNQSSYGQYPQPHAEYSTDTVIYKGGPQPAPGRGALPEVSLVKHSNIAMTSPLYHRLRRSSRHLRQRGAMRTASTTATPPRRAT